MNILIIGGGGFLGQELSKYLEKYNFTIFCTSHIKTSNKNFFQFNMETELSKDILNKTFEAVIYCSHIYDINKSERLIEWYKKTFAILSSKTKKQIYISSYSANPNATSSYGLTKYKIEKFFVKQNAYSVSPGLIVGNGGIYNKIKHLVIKLPIIAIPMNKKENNLPIIDVVDVSIFIKNIIANDIERRNYNIFSEIIDLKTLVQKIANQCNKKRIILGINAFIVLKGMKVIESIGLKLPVTSDSLMGFITNQKYHVKSDIEVFTKIILKEKLK